MSSITPFQLPDTINSDTKPATIEFNNEILLVYKGNKGDTDIYFSSSPDGQSWNGTSKTNNLAPASSGPSLVMFNGAIYAFFLSTADSNIHYFQTTDGKNWGNNSPLPALVNSSQPPSPIVIGSRLYLIYKGSGNDSRMFMVYTQDGVNWSS